jgi:tellurite resistance protein
MTAVHATSARSIAHLPLPLFAAPMGIGGLGLAWREAAHVLHVPALIGESIVTLAAIVWIAIAAVHLARLARHPEAVQADLRHPVRSAFAGAITIGLMLVAGGLLPHAHELAANLWLVASVVHLLIAAWTIRTLLGSPREAATLTPPLLIPMVGNILAPVIGAKLGFETLSWMLFGIGALLWVLVQPLLLWRILVGPPLPEKLRPTLAIFLAPPAVGVVALANLTHGFGPVVLSIYGFAVLLALVLLSMVGQFLRAPFAMSWWGLTFPSAAFAIATLLALTAVPSDALMVAAWAILVIATAVVALVSVRTLGALMKGELLQPEG